MRLISSLIGFVAWSGVAAAQSPIQSITISPVWPEGTALSQTANGIQSTEFGLAPKYLAKLQATLGRRADQATLQAIQNAVYFAAYEAGYPLASIGFPDQDFGDGHLYLYIGTGYMYRLGFTGNVQTDEAHLRKFIRQQPLAPFDRQMMLEDLEVLNLNDPRAYLQTQPTGNPAWVDVAIHMQEPKPVTGFVSLDNSGTDVSGETRLNFGLSYNNLFNRGDQISYTFTTDGEFKHVQSHRIGYQTLLPWRHALEASLSINDTETRRITTGQVIDQTQKTDQLSVMYKIPMRPVLPRLGGTLRAGFELKDAEFSSVRTPGPQRPASDADIFNLILGYGTTKYFGMNLLSFDTSLVHSSGGVGSNNTDAAFQISRVGARADYTIVKASLRYLMQFADQFSLTARIEGQSASTNLLSSERFSAGGQYSVRGFQQGIAQGDDALFWGLELSGPTLKVSDGGSVGPITLRPVVFYEGAELSTKIPSAGEADRHLESYGIGFRLGFGARLSLQYDYGIQINDSGINDLDSNRHHFRLSARF